MLVVSIRYVVDGCQATRALEAPLRRSLRGIEDLLALDALEVDQVVEARLVNVQRVDLTGAYTAPARAPSDAELRPVRTKAQILRPLRGFERVKLLDLLRDLSVGSECLQCSNG